MNSDLREIKWSSDELKYSLESDIDSTKSFAQKLKQMRKMLSISKKLASAFGLKTKGSDRVATLQQVKINSMMLDELQSMHRMQLLAYLDSKEKAAKQDVFINKIILEEKKNGNLRGSRL